MLGCDYLKRMNNCGFATLFNKVFPRLVQWDVKELKKVLEKETRFKKTDMHMNRLEQTINLFSRAPVLNVHDDLVPMNECSCDKHGVKASDLTCLHIASLLFRKKNAVMPNYLIIFSFATIDGSKLPSLTILTYDGRYEDMPSDTPFPNFSVMNFDVIHRCCRSLMLQLYVASKLGFEDSKSREELIHMAEKLITLNKPMMPPEKVPTQIDAWTLHGVMKPIDGSNW